MAQESINHEEEEEPNDFIEVTMQFRDKQSGRVFTETERIYLWDEPLSQASDLGKCLGRVQHSIRQLRGED